MESKAAEFPDVDAYIASFPEPVQTVLRDLREIIGSCIPEAEEAISYGMPTFKQNGGYVVYFGGYKKHVSLYPAPIDHPLFSHDLAPYASGRGTAKFPLNEALPRGLIERVVKHNEGANARRAAAKGKKASR